MFKFFIKKNFADEWDNFFFILLSNVILLALFAGCFFAVTASGSLGFAVQTGVFIVCMGLIFTAIFAWGANASKIADFDTGTFGTFFSAIKPVFGIGFIFGALLSVFVIIVRFALAYYLTIYLKDGAKFALICTAVLAWFGLVCVIALQWFVPLFYLQTDNGFVKCLKKSFIIFFDNAGFSVKVFILNVFQFVLSCITIGLYPNLNGITLTNMNALRLVLYKYDWMEEMEAKEPGFMNDRDKRNEVPWDELLAEDKEILGERKIGSFLFPWK